ncbi:nitrogenase component 1, partial [Arthrospira platensis SPKY1]|nr:nitrogenase component 1 [Arthrospira platensis SPKY1]
ADQARIREHALSVQADLIVGSSKGFPLAKELGIPLLRTGFPVHDRFGAQRQLSLGYRGTQILFDSIVNTLMEARQNASAIGYSYI